MEKLLVAEALDERDFLRKKILEKIGKLKVVAVVQTADKTTEDGVEIEKFKSDAVAAVQSIRDQIARYKAINLAIAKSNATETITVGGKTMTRAEAITLRKDHTAGTELEETLNRSLFSQINNGKVQFTRMKKSADQVKDRYINTILQAEGIKELPEEKLNAVSTMTDGNYPVLLDPISLADKVDTFVEDQEKFYKELETAIKVSNASTFIEV